MVIAIWKGAKPQKIIQFEIIFTISLALWGLYVKMSFMPFIIRDGI